MTKIQTLENEIDNTIISLYLSYVNDFITVKAFASHYNLSVEGAEKIIKIGRDLNEALAKKKNHIS